MNDRLTPKSLSGFEARFVLTQVRQMIASSDDAAPISSDDRTALEVIEEIISSSSDAPACGITAPSLAKPD